MKGFRTILVGLGMAIGAPALQFLGGVDWTQYFPPQYAPIAAGIIMIGMRLITNTQTGSKE